ncbi:hypothetical protein I600_766 [Maribacter dokdonensis DSW-8]|nr:hypothetical protein I600_766 [Maribacter dokdonensis DSW-8]
MIVPTCTNAHSYTILDNENLVWSDSGAGPKTMRIWNNPKSIATISQPR